MWLVFLESPEVYYRLFIDFSSHLEAQTLDWYTDAVKALGKGFRGHHKQEWFCGIWNEDFLKQKNPSIEYLELYAVAVSVALWLKNYKNSRIALFCDNESVVHMLNNQSSKCRNCMVLIRMITLQYLTSNVRLYAKHVRTHLNGRADALSRGKIQVFHNISRRLGTKVNESQTSVPDSLADIENIWID